MSAQELTDCWSQRDCKHSHDDSGSDATCWKQAVPRACWLTGVGRTRAGTNKFRKGFVFVLKWSLNLLLWQMFIKEVPQHVTVWLLKVCYVVCVLLELTAPPDLFRSCDRCKCPSASELQMSADKNSFTSYSWNILWDDKLLEKVSKVQKDIWAALKFNVTVSEETAVGRQPLHRCRLAVRSMKSRSFPLAPLTSINTFNVLGDFS